MVVFEIETVFFNSVTVASSNVTNGGKMFKLIDIKNYLPSSVSSLLFTVITALKAWESIAVAKDLMELHKKFFKQVHVRQSMKLSASHRSSVRLQIAVHRKWLKFHKKVSSGYCWNVLLRKSNYKTGFPRIREFIYSCLFFRTGLPRWREYILSC